MNGAVHPQADRLDRFFRDWRAARAEEPLGLLAERLNRFLASLRTLTSPEDLAARGVGPALDPIRLQAVFDTLRAPLAGAKAAGAFFNAWAAAGLKRDEVRNAAVLASLLDPQLCPGTGPAFLWELLSTAGGDSLPSRAALVDGYTVRTEDCPLGRGDNRIDVTIEGQGFLLFIEVKIDAGEGALQLDRYDGVLRAKARLLGKQPSLIYLSPRPPVNLPAEAVHITWLDVATAARKAGKPPRGRPQSVAEALLTQFSIHATAFTGKTYGPARTRQTVDQQLGRP